MLKITKEQLEKIYRENSLKNACKILNVSHMTLLKYIKLAGISQKGKGNRQPKKKFLIVED